MGLIEEVLEQERKVLKEVGHELNSNVANPKYPDKYYKDYVYNLYEDMEDEHKEQYGGGSGGELTATASKPAKMASIRSSSAMTFNILGNRQIVMNEDNSINHNSGVYHIEYEKKYETISNGNRQQPANLDAFLESEDGSEIIFCEFKMLEWFSKNTGELKEAYTEESNYRHKNVVSMFQDAIQEIKRSAVTGCFEYYDVWQMFKHTLAVHNYMEDKGWGNYKKVTLLNVVFEPDTMFMSENAKKRYEYQRDKEDKGFKQFKEALNVAGILKDGKNFEVRYISAKDFINCFDIPEEKRKYLRRYTLEG